LIGLSTTGRACDGDMVMDMETQFKLGLSVGLE